LVSGVSVQVSDLVAVIALMKLREIRSHFFASILVTTELTAETAENAEIRKKCMKTRTPSAFLCDLGGEILSFTVDQTGRFSGRQLG
jgi:hypothetical protein